MFHLTFVLIAYFDWLLGPIDGKFSKKKILKNLLFRNCLGGSMMYKALPCIQVLYELI